MNGFPTTNAAPVRDRCISNSKIYQDGRTFDDMVLRWRVNSKKIEAFSGHKRPTISYGTKEPTGNQQPMVQKNPQETNSLWYKRETGVSPIYSKNKEELNEKL